MSRKLSHEEFLKKVYERNEHVRNGEIEIRGVYNGKDEPIECYCKKHNVTWFPTPGNLYKGHGCRLCKGEKISKSKMTSKEKFIDLLKQSGNLTALYGEYNGMNTDTEFICSKGHIFIDKPATVLYGGVLCPYCSNHKVLVGFNDLWTTHPDIAKLLKNPADGYTHTYGSKDNVDFVCPDCGNIINAIIYNVCRQNLSCSICGDGISYPEKFVRQMLLQLKVDFIAQVTKHTHGFTWVKDYRYDCYFEYGNAKYFIETDGGIGHGKKVFKSKERDIDGKKRDKEKDKLAAQHGIDMIRIDCDYSMVNRYNHVKSNILQSELSKIFDLSAVNWDICDIKSQNSLVKNTCELYMSGIKSPVDIGHILQLSDTTVRAYLKKGNDIGWCDYDPKAAIKKRRKPVIAKNITDGVEYYFNSYLECEKELTKICGIPMFRTYISNSCKSGKSYKGFLFEDVSTTTQN